MTERESKPQYREADLKELRGMADFNCRLYTSEQELLRRSADEIECLRKAINDALAYCYKFEREHVAGHPGTGALLPIMQDLQAAVGR